MKRADFKSWSLLVCYAKDSDIPLMTDNNVVSINVYGSITQIVKAIEGNVRNYIACDLITPRTNLRKHITECVDNKKPYCLNIEHGGNMLSFRVDRHLLSAGITIKTSSDDEKE